MPTAFSRNLIFLHIPKCGGMSVTQALEQAGIALEFTGSGLWTRLGSPPLNHERLRRLRKVFPINTISGFHDAHLPAVLLREFVTAEEWARSFKFAFVRNPWDLVVSTFEYIRQNLEHFRMTERDYAGAVIDSTFPQFVQRYPLLASDMSSMLDDDGGNVIVDYVGKFESLEADFAKVCRHLEITATLPHLNRSNHGHYREYYDAESRDIVARHFARDIERYTYSF